MKLARSLQQPRHDLRRVGQVLAVILVQITGAQVVAAHLQVVQRPNPDRGGASGARCCAVSVLFPVVMPLSAHIGGAAKGARPFFVQIGAPWLPERPRLIKMRILDRAALTKFFKPGGRSIS